MNLLSPLVRPGAGCTACTEIMQRDRGRSAQPAGKRWEPERGAAIALQITLMILWGDRCWRGDVALAPQCCFPELECVGECFEIGSNSSCVMLAQCLQRVACGGTQMTPARIDFSHQASVQGIGEWRQLVYFPAATAAPWTSAVHLAAFSISAQMDPH